MKPIALLVSAFVATLLACSGASSREFEEDPAAAPPTTKPSVPNTPETTTPPPPPARCDDALATDPLNCGRCGHSCLGGACAAGECKPGKVVQGPLSEAPIAMAIDATTAYWVTNKGSLMSCPLAGCPVAKPLASGLGVVSAIAIDNSYLYWAVFGTPESGYQDGAIVRASKTGTGRTTLADKLKQPDRLSSDGTRVYWAEGPAGAIRTCTVAGCGLAPTTVVSAQATPVAPLADPTSLYWGNQATGEVLKIDKTTVAATSGTLLTGAQGPVIATAIDATSLYWASFEEKGKIVKIDKNGAGTITLAQDQKYSESVAVDATRVYWSTQLGVFSADKATGANPKTLMTVATPFVLPRSIVVDDTSIYWVENGASKIMRLAK